MKLNKLFALFLSILFFSATLGGCWNYVDADSHFVVMGVAIDKDKETNEYIIYTEIAKAKGGSETELLIRVESARGITLFDAARNSIMKIGAKLYWGHTMIYVISESVAREGIADAMSYLSRQTQIRADMFILIADDESLEKIFKFDPPIHEDVSQHLHDLLDTYEASGKYRRSPLYKVLYELASSEKSLMLPIVKMIEDESEDDNEDESKDEEKDSKESSEEKEQDAGEIVIVEGCAIFVGDKMAAKLDEIESRSALILKSEVEKNYILSIEEKGKMPKCSIEIINSNLKMNPTINDDTLSIQIELELEGDIVEMQTIVDFINDEKKGELEKEFEKMMELQLMAAINKAQNMGSDIFGFAGVTHRKLPSFWKRMPSVWDDVYKDAEFNVTVKLNIFSSSLSMNPIKVGR